MAQYDVTCSCGHDEHVTLYGKHTERERRMAAMAKRPCTACRAKAAREAGIDKGTDKQVAWAFEIREKLIKDAKSAVGWAAGTDEYASLDQNEKKRADKRFAAIVNWYEHLDNARTIIDLRDAHGRRTISAYDEYNG